jgi:NNP family nitrate/nitrite transporter-like MFS transporter
LNINSTPGTLGSGQDQEHQSFLAQSGPLLFLAAIFFLNFMARIILAPLMPVVEKDLGVSHGEAGSLFLFLSTGFLITLLGSGFFSSRLNHRRTIILSSLAVGLALIGVSFTKGLWSMRLGLFLVGLATGIYLPSGIATLTSLINPRHYGKSLAIHELAPNLSFVAAPLVSEALLGWISWRGILALLGAASVLLGIAFARFGRGGEFPGVAPSPGSIKTLLALPSSWIMLALFSLGISGTFGIYTMLPLYLVTERGMERQLANTLIALSRIAAVGTSFLAGWASDRYGPKATMVAVFLLTGLVTMLLGVVPDSWVVAIVFVQPALAACFFPAGFAALSMIGPPRVRNLAVSLTIPFAFLVGAGAVPTGIGNLGDAGFFSLGIIMAGGLILAGFLLSLHLKFSEDY